MQTPRSINDPSTGLVSLVAILLSVLLLLGQSLFIVPAGQVAVVTTLGKVSGGSVSYTHLTLPTKRIV